MELSECLHLVDKVKRVRIKGKVFHAKLLVLSGSVPNLFALLDTECKFGKYKIYGPRGYQDFCYLGDEGTVGVQVYMKINYTLYITEAML